MNSFRGGMQVHAVPEDERAIDSRGQQLPWGYSYADSSLNRKQPVERGPFGRPTSRRATSSRSRTPTTGPGSKDDPVALDNVKAIDDVMGKWKKSLEEKENKQPREQRPPITSSRLPHAQSATDIAQTAPPATAAGKAATFKEPTEVLIYGYGRDSQWAAIEFYESTSAGRIYEDYDRYPPKPRYSTFLSQNRATIPRSLPPDAIRKINTYSGGDHWIKVTFDSPEAAERACFYSPHIVHGHLAYAELWRGVGPNADVPISANSANMSGASTLSQRRTAQPTQSKPFSTMPSRMHSAPALASQPTEEEDSPNTSETLSSSATATGTDVQSIQQSSQTEQQVPLAPEPQKPLRVRGAKRAVLLPASQALLPVPPWSQRTFGHLPFIGSLFGGDPNAKPGQGGGIIGYVVPRKDDGTFDWDNASMYWRLCWWVDSWLQTDLCGMKGDD